MKKKIKYLLLVPTLLLSSMYLIDDMKKNPFKWNTGTKNHTMKKKNHGVKKKSLKWNTITALQTKNYAENSQFQSVMPPLYGENLSSDQQSELSLNIVTMPSPNKIRVNPITSNLLEIDLIAQFSNQTFQRQPLVIDNVTNSSYYSISSTDDANYEEILHPLQSALKRRVTSAPIVHDDLRILERVYLELPYALQDNHHYTVTLDTNLTGNLETLAFTYKKSRISTAIHIDPEGYLPTDKKTAYLGMQLGSLGELISEDLSFNVRNLESNNIVYSGVGTVENSSGWRENFTNLDTLYKNVVAFDFSSVVAEGEYVVETAITGISQPIIIANNVYRKTLNTLALGVYNQRRGEDIVMPYSRHERLSTIENNTYVYKSDDLDPFIVNNYKFDGIKYPTANEGKKVSFEASGHMDAGDYSIYTYNSSMFTWQLLLGLDTFGAKLAHDNLGIPESGDSIPDMYQEMMLELKWLMGMQDDDGGVFGMSKPKGQSYQSQMTGVDAALERYLTPKDTPHTASFSATMARAARSNSITQYNPELTSILAQKALDAWAWLEANEGYDGWHHYGAKEEDKDDRVWAAIELYALTGESKFHDYFVTHHQPELRYDGVDWFNYGYGFTNRVVALWDDEQIAYPLDESMKSRSINRYKEMLEHYIELADITPYSLVLEGAAKRWNQLGWYFPLSKYGYDLVLGHYLYADERYLDLAKDQLHFTLGANPSNQSSITGLGNKRIQSLVDQKSRFDSIAQPVNGLPVSPIVSGSSWLSQYGHNLSAYSYPQTTYNFSDGMAYGLLDETYDGWNVNAEFTIEKLGAMLVVLGYMSEVETQSYDYPKFTLMVEALGDGEFRPYLDFINQPEGGKVVWFANDVAVSVDPNFILKQDFDTPTYKLGAEIVDNNGRRWFAETLVNTRDYTNADIPLAAFDSTLYAHVWHFDNNLSSDKGIDLSFTGNASLSDENLFWMQTAEGKALRVNGDGDGVETSIALSELLDGKSLAEVNDITVEALIYPEAFVSADKLGEMIKFEQSWGAQLQLARFPWVDDLWTRLSKNILGPDGKITDALTLNQWHHIKMKIDKQRVYLIIDGVEIYNKLRDEEVSQLFDSRDISIYLGDFYGWIDEFRVVINEDEPRVPVEPFSTEEYAHVWHFDSDLNSDKGIELSFQNDAYLDDTNLGWMQTVQGNALRVNGDTDGVKASIYMSDLLEGKSLADVSSVTVEALIYPESFAVQDELGEMIKFEQSWGAQLELVRFRWEDIIRTRLARKILGDDRKITDALALNQWHHVKMKIDKKRIYLSIDGIEIYNELRNREATLLFDHRQISISLGDFNGWIDEFKITLAVDEL
jgi:endoglucanase